MRSHLDSVSRKSGCISYLSATIQNEIISLLGERVSKYIITACKKAKYFSIIFETTPDAAHVERMSQIIRFVEIKRNSVDIKEAFIDFIPLEVKTAEGITEAITSITSTLEIDGFNFNDCRGHSYENESTMAGINLEENNRF